MATLAPLLVDITTHVLISATFIAGYQRHALISIYSKYCISSAIVDWLWLQKCQHSCSVSSALQFSQDSMFVCLCAGASRAYSSSPAEGVWCLVWTGSDCGRHTTGLSPAQWTGTRHTTEPSFRWSHTLPDKVGMSNDYCVLCVFVELQKTLYSCTVCIMIFSTAEAVPLSVYGKPSDGLLK